MCDPGRKVIRDLGPKTADVRGPGSRLWRGRDDNRFPDCPRPHGHFSQAGDRDDEAHTCHIYGIVTFILKVVAPLQAVIHRINQAHGARVTGKRG